MIRNTIPASFLEQEVRNGFTVSEVMKRSWAVYLDILEDIKGICDKNSLKLFACYGTLLGAVREHGFIAWDDDIDVGLVGPDYVRFLEVLSEKYADRYSVLNPYTKTWHSMNFTHISNTLSVSFEREHLRRWHGCPFMTGLDVYPYYYIPRNADDEKFIMDVLAKIDMVIGMNRQLIAQTGSDGMLNGRSMLGQAVAVKLVELQRETGYEFNIERPIENQLEILYDQVCRFTQKEDADYVARYDEYARDRTKKFPKDYFETIVSMPFEYTSVPVPIGYDSVLKARFGYDYIMPRQEKAAHGYPYFAKQLDDEKLYNEQIENSDRVAFGADIERKNSEKTPVLYHTGMRDMLIHCDSVIAKIRNVIQFFLEKKEDFELWWMPDVFLKTEEMAIDEVAPELMKQYGALIDEFIKQGGNICDIGTKTDKLIETFDEYYGDDGAIAGRFREAGKKTTIQDYSYKGIELDSEYVCDDLSGSYENPVLNDKKNAPEIPEEWKYIIYRADGSRKKIVLYITSVSVLYQYKDKLIDKLYSVMKIFKENANDIALLWRLEPLTSNIRSSINGSLIDRINDLVNDFCRERRGILIDGEPDKAVMLADAVYGDADEAMARCMKRGIPVMIENPEII